MKIEINLMIIKEKIMTNEPQIIIEDTGRKGISDIVNQDPDQGQGHIIHQKKNLTRNIMILVMKKFIGLRKVLMK